MFAVIKTGGRQYRVAANDVLTVHRLDAEVGTRIEIGTVLAHGEGETVTIGSPFVEGARVVAEVLEQGRGEKIIAFKKRRRQNSRRRRGHRQLLTTLRIEEILAPGAKPSRPAAAKAKAKTEEAPAEQPAAKAKARTEGVKDDLALIGGIGPALKKKLEGVGITSLAQLAALDAEAIQKLDEDLKLGGRIARDEWVEQARELLAGKPPRARTDRDAAESGDAGKE
jgi:large subunit ribosomal protein L21